jgi:hypothetical protein
MFLSHRHRQACKRSEVQQTLSETGNFHAMLRDIPDHRFQSQNGCGVLPRGKSRPASATDLRYCLLNPIHCITVEFQRLVDTSLESMEAGSQVTNQKIFIRPHMLKKYSLYSLDQSLRTTELWSSDLTRQVQPFLNMLNCACDSTITSTPSQMQMMPPLTSSPLYLRTLATNSGGPPSPYQKPRISSLAALTHTFLVETIIRNQILGL